MALNWVGTYNLYSVSKDAPTAEDIKEQEKEEWEAKEKETDFQFMVGEAKDWILYITWGWEIGAAGNHHLQIYLQCKKQKRLTALVKYFSQHNSKATTWGIHWEKQYKTSTNTQARDYCWKECGERRWEWGKFKVGGRGTRTDISTAVSAIKGGITRAELTEQFGEIMIKYRTGMLGYLGDIEDMAVPKHRDIRVWVFWGPTNSGKTWTASDGRTHPSFYCTGTQLKWWCDYRREERLIIDEFGNDMVSIRELIKLIDGYKHMLPIKNGHTFGYWTEVFITTNLRYPEEFYPGALPAHRQALFRRVNKAIEFTKDWREQTPVIYEQDESEGEDEPAVARVGVPALVRQHGFIFDD